MKRLQLPDRLPVPVGKWEEMDPYGDAHRLKLGVRLTIGLALGVLVCGVLIAIGDRQVRLAVAGILALHVVFLIGVICGWLRIIRRLSRGRGLVAGDPFRPEGIDSGEARGEDDGT